MKKFLFCFVAIATVLCSGCNKDDEDNDQQQPPQPQVTDYAAPFIGTYDMSVDATLVVPVLGETNIPVNDIEVSITRKEGNEVVLTVSDQALEGYVNSSGLHVDPFISNTTIMGYDVAITVTVPVIEPPVDGRISGSAPLSATIAGTNVNGTADFVAIKR